MYDKQLFGQDYEDSNVNLSYFVLSYFPNVRDLKSIWKIIFRIIDYELILWQTLNLCCLFSLVNLVSSERPKKSKASESDRKTNRHMQTSRHAILKDMPSIYTFAKEGFFRQILVSHALKVAQKVPLFGLESPLRYSADFFEWFLTSLLNTFMNMGTREFQHPLGNRKWVDPGFFPKYRNVTLERNWFFFGQLGQSLKVVRFLSTGRVN